MFSTGLSDNRLILWGVVLEGALLVLINYTRWGNILLGTAPLGADVWWFLLPFAVVMVLLEEVRKWIVRKGLGYTIFPRDRG